MTTWYAGTSIDRVDNTGWTWTQWFADQNSVDSGNNLGWIWLEVHIADNEIIGLTDAPTRRLWSIRLADEVEGIVDAAGKMLIVAQLDVVGLADGATKLFSVALSEVVGLVDSSVRRMWSIRLIAETVGLVDTAVRRLRSIRISAETVGLVDGLVSKLYYFRIFPRHSKRPVRVSIIERVATRTATGTTVILKPYQKRWATMRMLDAKSRAAYQQLHSEATYEFVFRETPDPDIQVGKFLIRFERTDYEPLAPMTVKNGYITVPAKEL